MVRGGEHKGMMGLRTQRGAALVMAILVLLVLTVLGVYAVTTTIMETKIAGVEKVMENAFYAADGGGEYGREIIEWVLSNPNASLPSGADPLPDEQTFKDEVLGRDTNSHPSVRQTIGDAAVTVNVDRIREDIVSGGSWEFGGGEEVRRIIHYRIDAQSTGSGNCRVISTYRRGID